MDKDEEEVVVNKRMKKKVASKNLTSRQQLKACKKDIKFIEDELVKMGLKQLGLIHRCDEYAAKVAFQSYRIDQLEAQKQILKEDMDALRAKFNKPWYKRLIK